MPTVVYSADVFVRQQSGGISRYHAELFAEMRRLGVDARVVVGSSGHPYIEAAVDGVRRIPRFVPGRWARGAGSLTTRVSWMLAPGSIYHPTYYTAPLRRRGPSVVTFHDLIHLRGLSEDPETSAVVQGQRRWAKRADVLLAVSENTARDIEEILRVPRSRIRVVHLGVRNAGAAVGPTPRRSQTLLYVGHRGGYKNWRALVEALSLPRTKDWHLVCVGGGRVQEAEVELLRSMRVRDRVSFVTAGDAELEVLLRSVTALVYPSLYEGFGLPPLEAMARGTAVVASNRASIPEVCGDAAMLVDPHPDALAQAIERLGDDEVLKGLVDRGERRAASFTWQRTALQTRRIYDELV